VNREEFERMSERHRAEVEREHLEMERARADLHDRCARAIVELTTARAAFHGRMESFRRRVRAAPDEMGGFRVNKRRWRPRRGLEGGEPVPVEPRPKPKPLMDGAEAPIE
jgi:hypothetical protein